MSGGVTNDGSDKLKGLITVEPIEHPITDVSITGTGHGTSIGTDVSTTGTGHGTSIGADVSTTGTGHGTSINADKAHGPMPTPPCDVGEKTALRSQERAALDSFHSGMPILRQGRYNSCGTTSLAMAMEYLGIPANFRVIDSYIRPYPGAGTASTPGDIVAYARRAGLQARQHSGGTLDELAGHIRDRRPVTVLLNYEDPWNPSAMAHYVNVIGMERNEAGDITDVHVRNPWGRDEIIRADSFQRQWSRVRIVGQVPEGSVPLSAISNGLGVACPTFDRTYIVYDSPNNQGLCSDSIIDRLKQASTNTVMGGINELASGVNTIGRAHQAAGMSQIMGGIKEQAMGMTTIQRGYKTAGVSQMIGGTINSVCGGAAFMVGNLIGKNVEQGGEALMEVGRDMLDSDKVLEKISGGLACFFGSIIKAIGWLFSMVGGLMAAATDLVSKPFTWPAEKLNEKDALKEQILNTDYSHGEGDPQAVLQRAFWRLKARMLDTLLNSWGETTAKDREAAMRVILAAQASGHLSEVAEDFGGAEALVEHFEGEQRDEVRGLLGLPLRISDGLHPDLCHT